RAYHRPSEYATCENNRGDSAGLIWGLVLIHQLINRPRLRQAHIAFARRLRHAFDKISFTPGVERLPGKIRFNRHDSAMDFALLDREVDGPAALIAKHNGELSAHGFFEQPREEEAGAACAAGTALGRLTRLADVFNGFVRTVRANIKMVFAFRRRTNKT